MTNFEIVDLMQTRIRLPAVTTALLLATVGTGVRAQSTDPLARLRATSENTSLDAPGSLPWHLKLEVTLPPGTPASGAGTIEEWWSDPTHYRITYDLPNYKSTVIQQRDKIFRTPGAASTPYLLRFLLDQTVHPVTLPPEAGLSLRVDNQNFGGTTLDCIRIPAPDLAPPEIRLSSPVFCLVPGKPDLLVTMRGPQVAGRLKLSTFRGKQAPFDLVISRAGVLGARSHISLLQGQAQPYSESLETEGLALVPGIPSSSTPGVVPGKVIKNPLPVYPPFMRQQRLTGQVLLDVLIGADGHVQSATSIYPVHPIFAEAAVDAVKGWVYMPSLLNGVAVPMETTVTINFFEH